MHGIHAGGAEKRMVPLSRGLVWGTAAAFSSQCPEPRAPYFCHTGREEVTVCGLWKDQSQRAQTVPVMSHLLVSWSRLYAGFNCELRMGGCEVRVF